MTDLRSTQVLAESWVVTTADAVVSQVLAEAWLQYTPTTAFIASQILAEVWTVVPKPYRLFWLSAQTI